jgi:uncharacterized small protein (DUF1192 family)
MEQVREFLEFVADQGAEIARLKKELQEANEGKQQRWEWYKQELAEKTELEKQVTLLKETVEALEAQLNDDKAIDEMLSTAKDEEVA